MRCERMPGTRCEVFHISEELKTACCDRRYSAVLLEYRLVLEYVGVVQTLDPRYWLYAGCPVLPMAIWQPRRSWLDSDVVFGTSRMRGDGVGGDIWAGWEGIYEKIIIVWPFQARAMALLSTESVELALKSKGAACRSRSTNHNYGLAHPVSSIMSQIL